MKIGIILAILVTLILTASAAIAHDETAGEESQEGIDDETGESSDDLLEELEEELGEDFIEEEADPGITPDSPLWGMDRAMERINLFLTFGKAAKAEKRLLIAQERLAEARLMAIRGKIKALERAQDSHAGTLENLRARVAELQTSNPEEDLAQQLRLKYKLELHERSIKKAQTEIDIKIRGQLTEEQAERLRALVASFRNNTARIKVDIDEAKQRARIKIKAARDFDDEDVAELEDKLEIEALTHGKKPKVKAHVFIKIAERSLKAAEHRLGLLENETEVNETVLEAVRTHVNNASDLLEQAKEEFENENYEAAARLAQHSRRNSLAAIVRSLGRAHLNTELRERIVKSLKKDLEHRGKELRKLDIRIKDWRGDRDIRIRPRDGKLREEIRERIRHRDAEQDNNIEEEEEQEEEEIDEEEDQPKVEFELKDAGLEVEGENLEPGTIYDIFVDGEAVGDFMANDDGKAEALLDLNLTEAPTSVELHLEGEVVASAAS